VTTNQITSQVAAMVINGMWATTEPVPLAVQASAIDSLEPAYSCPASAALFNGIKSFDNPVWKAHLAAAAPLYEVLDDISGVPANDRDFHIWLDHYYDNLSARQCHGYPLPCKLADGSKNSSSAAACVTQALADEVYRFGHWEYSRLYRDEREGLAGSVASIGVWIAEVAQHLRDVKDGRAGAVRWRHNVAHDGSMARVLSVLQVEEMVWPGMGTEVVFEVWKGKKECGKKRRIKSESGFYVRVLFSGRVLRSSNPSLGVMDMLPVETLLAYFDGLVGERAALVRGLCNATSS
jgi:acid phosphatase